MEALVDIICPNCSRKAQFHSEWTGGYVLHPDTNGKVTCLHCGLNKDYVFSNKDYFYQIQVDERILFARNLDSLIGMRNYFRDGHKKPGKDPELDFPKSFYLKREEIVKKINAILEKESH
jgi:hypothetical protein